MSNRDPEHNLIEFILSTLNTPDGEKSRDGTVHYSELTADIMAFLDQIPGGFFIYRAEGDEELIYANQAMFRIFGCDNEEEFREITHNSFKGIVHPDDLDAVEESIVQQIAGSQYDLDYVEYRIIRKDGSVRHIEDYGHYLYNEAMGGLFYVFISDATEKIERDLAERASLIREKNKRESEIKQLIEEYDRERSLINKEHLRRMEIIQALSANEESILYADLDADSIIPYRVGPRTNILFYGKFETRSFNDFAREYVDLWVHPDDRETVSSALAPDTMRQRLAGSKTFFFNYRCVENGTVKHLQLRAVAIDAASREVVIGIRDIDEELLQETRQKKILEDALDDAKRAANAKNIFLSNMSHEMRTPLNAIIGYLRLAQKKVPDSEPLKRYLDIIGSASGQILDLTEKVLALSYMESNADSVDDRPCDLIELMNDVSASLRKKAERNGVTVFCSYDRLKNSRVLADVVKLKQILMQIGDNATKYTKSGGAIKLELVESEVRPNGFSVYKFIIADNGKGISKEALEHIFDPFEREFDSTTGGVFGAGLGLTIAKKLAELMGGDIAVESEVGRGSAFTVTLGFRVQEGGDDAMSNDELARAKEQKILIVEDNELNLEIETEVLEDLGFSVEGAANGQIAVDMLKSKPEDYYAVVLMDIQMPVMDGLRATERIRHLDNPALSGIPIIALSANAFDSDKRLSAQAGMDAHLSKPVDVDQLIKTMAAILHLRTLRK